MSKVLYEIPPLTVSDCFHIVERHKSQFDYPIHRHREFELNFIQNAPGVRRIVGDSVEEIGEYDLVLIGGEDLEHVWEQGNCVSIDIREITIQFPSDLFTENWLVKTQFASIKQMLADAEHGLVFPMEAILNTYGILDSISSEKAGFEQFLHFLELMYRLSTFKARPLASSSFAHAIGDAESRRISMIKEYINNHYSEDLSLNLLASLAGMSPASFSRFFKMRTNKTISSYIIDIRLGHAARALVDTTRNVSEICYSCGFNNISNFNRMFKAKRGVVPHEFRALYKKRKVTV